MSKTKKNRSVKGRTKNPSSAGKSHTYLYGLLIAGLVLVALAGWYFGRSAAGEAEVFAPGLYQDCLQMPEFPTKHGMRPPYAVDLRPSFESSLTILEAAANGKKLSLPEWTSFGNLGPYTVDHLGNIFVSPMPHVSLSNNPPAEQNKVLIIRTATGEISEFSAFPVSADFAGSNPFGVIGLVYDCQSSRLFASSVAGSRPDNEMGTVYSIDPVTRESVDKLEGFDAYGLGVYTTTSGRRLFMGSARRSAVYSVGVDKSGMFVGEPRLELSLAALEGSGFDKVHRIRFFDNGLMELKGTEFSYSLIVASDSQRYLYYYWYDPDFDRWVFEEQKRQ